MDNNSLCVNSASKISAGAFIGLCAGTLAAPKRMSIKTILAQRQEKFDETFNPSLIKHMNEEQKQAFEVLKSGRNEFKKSGSSLDKTIKTAAKQWKEKFISIEVDPSLTQRLENKKEFLQKAIKETNIIDVNKRLNSAKKLFTEYSGSSTLKDDLVNLVQQKKGIRKTLEFPIEQYREAISAVNKDRMKRILSLPNSGFEVKKYYKKMENAIAEKRTLMSNKLYELTNNPMMKESYNKIKCFLPESRIRNAVKGAAIFGTLTAIWLIFFNPSNRT